MGIDLWNEVVARWDDPDPRHASLLRGGGITVICAPANSAFEAACAKAGIQTLPGDGIRSVSQDELGRAAPGVPVALKAGVWPGIRGRDAAEASATRSLWVDANGYRVAYLRALYPKLAPVLAYQPDRDAGISAGQVVPFSTLELALVEAWAAGGNYVLALEPKFREALLAGDQRAVDAWHSLGRTSHWLRQHAALFRQKALPNVTVLVDQGEISAEVANLMFRQNVSPALTPAADPPAPDPVRRAVLVAAGIDAPTPDIAARILAHAGGGSTLVVDAPADGAWWKRPAMKLVKGWEDRDLFAFGKGQVLAYKEPVSDPGELALDVLDLLTQNRRPVRLWNCPGGIALATSAPASGPVSGRALLHIVNYASPVDLPLLARIQGSFARATILRPEAPPLEARVAKRGTASEVELPQLLRVAVVVFS